MIGFYNKELETSYRSEIDQRYGFMYIKVIYELMIVMWWSNE